MVALYISYWRGEFFVGHFPDRTSAEKHFNDHKERYRDYAGEKHGYPYGTPVYHQAHEAKE